MKILLTGASGFVGSHILDSLRGRGLPTVLLLRPTSQKRFISRHLGEVEVRPGSIGDPASLRQAMAGITHVIHCAGATKAARVAGFYEVNQAGTRNVVAAINEQSGPVRRLVHISSLAAAGPARPEKPAREEDVPGPVSEYGKSKLAGELEVRNHCRVEHVILRPPAVYGPRDEEFLRLFRAVKRHVWPRASSAQALSLVYVKDLAEAVAACLNHPAAAGQTYFVAAREVVTARSMTAEIAAQMNDLDGAVAAAGGAAVADLPGGGGLVAPDGQAQRPEPAEVRRAARAGLGVRSRPAGAGNRLRLRHHAQAGHCGHPALVSGAGLAVKNYTFVDYATQAYTGAGGAADSLLSQQHGVRLAVAAGRSCGRAGADPLA